MSDQGRTTRSRWTLPLVYLGGLVFGFGLALSRMVRPEVVLDFLQWDDLGLLFVMGGAAAVAGLTFQLTTRFVHRPAPLTGRTYGLHRHTLDRHVLTGGAVFGVGWGLSGLCPGAAYASLGVGNWPVLIGIAGMFLGAYLHGVVRSLGQPTVSEATVQTGSTKGV